MQKVIDLLSSEGEGEGKEFEFPPAMCMGKISLAEEYLSWYGFHLIRLGRMDKQLPPPNEHEQACDILLEAYTDILKPGYEPHSGMQLYHHLYALNFFYDSLIGAIPAMKLETFFMLDYALLRCVERAASDTERWITATDHKNKLTNETKQRLQKAKQSMAARAKRREQAVLDAAKEGLPGVSVSQKIANLETRLRQAWEAGGKKGPEPYKGGSIRIILKKHELI